MSKTYISLLFLLCMVVVAGKACADCAVSTTSVNFNDYEPLSGGNVDSTGTITISCTLDAWVTTAIGASIYSGGFNPRKLQNAASGDLMNYNLYINASRTQIWGDGTQGTYTVGPTYVSQNGQAILTIYGRIPGAQDVGIGSYAEPLVVTITF